MSEIVLSPAQQRVASSVDAAVLWFARHWVAGMLLVGSIATGLPVLAPILRAGGHDSLASPIYLGYRLVCHQRADRSFHIAGQKMAFCERDFAITGACLALLLIYAGVRRLRSIDPLRVHWAIALSAPMAVDGFTQLFGLRESTWELRVVTGSLFSAGWCWYCLAYLEAGFADVRAATLRRRSAGGNLST